MKRMQNLNYSCANLIKSALFACGVGIATFLSACQSGQLFSNTVSSQPNGQSRAIISGPLKPFKDSKFAYRTALEVRDGGDFLRAPYDETKDINERDEQPVRKVSSSYIKPIPASRQYDLTYKGATKPMETYAVGRVKGGSLMTVIYLHGKNGNREWGFDDERFGGNYNRLKNLMLENGGAYFSPDFTDFEDRGAADIAALVSRQRPLTSGKLVLACGSLGTNICWKIANNPKSAALLDGLVLLGGFPQDHIINNMSSKKIPIYIAHGSLDNSFAVSQMENFYSALKARDYPVRMTIFETGKHGTPVRMIDWRQALNWIAAH